MRNLYLLIMLLVVGASACKKDKDSPNKGYEEGQKIEGTLIGNIYRVATITDQGGADASGKFAACIMDDRYLFKDRGTVEITQGVIRCGKETADKKNASWGVAYGQNEVTGLQFPYFSSGADYYQTREFSKSLFNIDHNTGVLLLMFKVGTDTYTIKLEQTL